MAKAAAEKTAAPVVEAPLKRCVVIVAAREGFKGFYALGGHKIVIDPQTNLGQMQAISGRLFENGKTVVDLTDEQIAHIEAETEKGMPISVGELGDAAELDLEDATAPTDSSTLRPSGAKPLTPAQ